VIPAIAWAPNSDPPASKSTEEARLWLDPGWGATTDFLEKEASHRLDGSIFDYRRWVNLLTRRERTAETPRTPRSYFPGNLAVLASWRFNSISQTSALPVPGPDRA